MIYPVICGCLHEYVHVSTFTFLPLLVVGAWFLAVIIGVVGGAKLWSLGPSVVGSFSYSLIFSTYVMMISSGLVVHCLYLVECGLAPPSMVSKSSSKSVTSCCC